MDSYGPELIVTGRRGIAMRLRTNWHGIVFVLSGFAVFYGAHQAIEIALRSEYRSTYVAAEFVVERLVVVPDANNPKKSADYWVEGRIEPGRIPHREPVLRSLEGGFVLLGDPRVPAQRGRRMPVWWSKHHDARIVAMATMPCIPQQGMAWVWLAFAAGVFFVGIQMARRLGVYLQREHHMEILFDEKR